MDALAVLNSMRQRAAMRRERRAARLLDMAENGDDRRDFLRTAGGFAAGAAGTLALTACGSSGVVGSQAAAGTTGPSDPDILNFALNLEYLEANFYAYAATGSGIAASLQTGTGTQGAIVAGQKANLSNPLVIAYANEIAQDELNHVEYLRSALGSSAVAQPAIDVSAGPSGSFSTAAQAAGLVPAGTAFNPYANDEAFLLGAYIFEDVGVTAYNGAAPLITSKTYLQAAASILAVEAYHAGLVRTALYALGLQTPAPAINPYTATAAISALRAKLDGTNNDDQGIQGANSTISNIVDANSNSLAYFRTTGQVLNIVYGSPNAVNMGLFFPAGMNGAIHTAA
jgi:hypothetical protein